MAHLGGAITGFLLTPTVLRPRCVATVEQNRFRWIALVLLVMMFLLAIALNVPLYYKYKLICNQ